ncbi:MAG: DNA-formamidopyrimidine glycosylase family protein [Syntrophaceae bacterium]
MPELPDVEILKKYFDKHCLGLKISKVQVLEKRILRDTTAEKIKSRLEGRTFVKSRRHGKHLFVEIGNGSLSYIGLHFGMDGGLEFLKQEDPPPEYTRIIFRFDGNYLAYTSRRMLGGVRAIKGPEDFVGQRQLGPDALGPDFSRDYFLKAIAGRKTSIKAALMDQQIVAGIGNVYSDEILYQAGILPDTGAGLLDEEQLTKLYGKILDVLKTAVKYDADARRFPPRSLLRHRHRNGNCPCGGKVASTRVAGRTSFFCPACQK